ncbi:MAG: type pilus biosis/stability protein PilW [Pseudomonadota bacterium]
MKTIKYALCLLLAGGAVSGCSNASSGSGDKNKADDYYTQLGVGYLKKGRLDLANLNLEKALAKDSHSADANHYYAVLQERLGNNAKADYHFHQALRADGKNSDLLNNYGSFLCQQGNYAEAEQTFMTALRDPLYKTPEFAYTNAGICVRKSGNDAKAEDYFHQALLANNRFSEALYQMAKLSHEKADDAKAQAFLYRYNEAAPATPDTLLLCYKVQTAMNEPLKAEACASELQRKYPDSAAAGQID